MSAEQWEALAIRAAGWIPGDGTPDPEELTQYCELRARRSATFHVEIAGELAIFALIAHAMALLTSEACICEPDHGHRSLLPRDPADGNRVIGCPKPGPGGVEPNMRDVAARLRAGEWPGLGFFLRHVHDRSDRGELRALLVEAWGPSPAAKPECTGFAASWCPIHGDCKCPYIHGIADNGRTMSDPGCPLHAEGSRHGDDERLAGMASDLRALAARESARPDPCLDPDKMHGATDGFGGSDYP